MSIRYLLFLPVLASSGEVFAQSGSSGALESVVIIDSRPSDSVVAPELMLGPDELDRRRETTIGEMLRGTPGVSATGFGANASRPIIRGQDADRVKILQNSAPAQDISAMSFDHAVAINPFAIDQVEILRGASVLLYGANPLGGAVNLVDRRIPKGPLGDISRSVDLRADSANNGRQGAIELEAGSPNGLSWHLDGFIQKNGDTRTPRFTDPSGVTGNRVRNTSAESQGAGIGFSKTFGGSYWGASIESFQSQYGVPKETDVRLDMHRDRLAIAGEQFIEAGPFEKARVRMGTTSYRHAEIESGVTGTTFNSSANDGRVELIQRPLSGWRGVVGFQWEHSRLRVTGDEALLPDNSGHHLGLFMMQERALGVASLRLAARIEDVRADSSASYQLSGDRISQNGPGIRRSYAPYSASAELRLPLTQTTQASLSFSQVQRAPSNSELFSMGIHRPSGLFEAGNIDLKNERGNHLDLALTHLQGPHQFKVSLYASRYSNYITLIRRGYDMFEEFPIYDYLGVGAQFHGLELEYKAKGKLGVWQISPRVAFDDIIGKRTNASDERIPRMTPARLTMSVDLVTAGILLRPEILLVGSAKLGEGETNPASGYGMLNFVSEFRNGNQIWFLKGQNLTDRLAYQATTVDEVRPYAPMAGRSLQAGLRMLF